MNCELEKVLEESRIHLETPSDFLFPFPPYGIQKDFMRNLYEALEGRKLSIFESPTGTGKSLSIICGALAWLKDHENRERSELLKSLEIVEAKNQKVSESPGKDWLSAQIKDMSKENLKRALSEKINQMNKFEERINQMRLKQKAKVKKWKALSKNANVESGVENEMNIAGERKPEDDEDIILEDNGKMGEELEEEPDEEPEKGYNATKIIFCSRTHSQLSQFVGEIKRTAYVNEVRLVPLASRQNYCINKAIRKLNNVSLMNEKCLEMQKSKSKVTEEKDGRASKRAKIGCRCPHMKNVNELSEQILIDIEDVDGVTRKGEELGSCPYYASRSAVKDAQVVVVPYNTLLHKGTREACGLQIENNIVIIDEAHNLLETVSHIHSTQISGHQLTHTFSQLTQYREKYESRFSPSNLLSLNQLIFVVGALIKFIGGKTGCGPTEASNKAPGSVLFTVAEFIINAEIDNYNLFKLLEFCRNSKITHKLQGFTERYRPSVLLHPPRPKVSGIKAFLQDISNKNDKAEPVAPEKTETVEGQPLVHILSLLQNFTLDYSEGRVVVDRKSPVGKSTIKYLLLDPTSTMKDLITKARSVILAGGTMQPFSEFKERLFLACGVPESQIVEFSCGHVIPKENILPTVVTCGPTNRVLDFSYQAREEAATLNELGRIFRNVCAVVPAGIVIFFPSYEYESVVYSHLEKSGVIAALAGRKKIFREPKKSGGVDAVLNEFASAAKSGDPKGGALLFSVVGGKLSEGLNFGDDLGRCVIVVGMPYANIKSPELVEKMNFLDRHVGKGAGREYYETSCMKAVNQCIGRAVRHRCDYSTVLLLDRRYSSEHVLNLLPKWIRGSLSVQSKFGPVVAQLVKFFKQRSSEK